MENRSSRRKPFRARREPTTDVTHIWRQRRDSNLGHIGGRPVLSPLRHTCSPSSTRRSVVLIFPSSFFKYVYCSFDFLEGWIKAYREAPSVSIWTGCKRSQFSFFLRSGYYDSNTSVLLSFFFFTSRRISLA